MMDQERIRSVGSVSVRRGNLGRFSLSTNSSEGLVRLHQHGLRDSQEGDGGVLTGKPANGYSKMKWMIM